MRGSTVTRFKSRSEVRPVEVYSGVIRRTLSHSERAMLVEMTAPKGSGAAVHQHAQDEMGYVVSGRARVKANGEGRELKAGDTYCIPAGESHELEALDDSVIVLAFAPLRPEYLD